MINSSTRNSEQNEMPGQNRNWMLTQDKKNIYINKLR